jgi:D-alanyl-D-alanine carboxypeptidase
MTRQSPWGEAISGDIDAFVGKMNSYAREIGNGEHTFFLQRDRSSRVGRAVITAKDVTIMTRKIFLLTINT